MKTPENTEEDSDHPEPADERYPPGTLPSLVVQPKYRSSNKN
jgi:hypothetical protein